MSFRQFGGLNYAARHNIVSSNLNSSNKLFVSQNVGEPNSIINFLSDISGNSNSNYNSNSNGNFNVGNGLNTSIINGVTYLNVDSSLNFINSIDSSNNTLNIGSPNKQLILNGNSYTYSPYSIGSNLSPPTFTINTTSLSTQITFNWSIPTSNNISNSLQQLNAILYANINGNIKTYPILQNYTYYLSSLNTIIISNFQSQLNGITDISNSTYFYYSPDFLNMSDSSNNILLLWYSNYGPYPNVCNIAYSSFLSIGVPSQVLINTPNQTNNGFNSITLPCYVKYTDSTHLSKGPPSITNYRILANGYSTSGSTSRYPTALQDAGPSSSIDISCNTYADLVTNFNLGSDFGLHAIYPDCSYVFNVAASNNGTSYGQIGSIIFKTEPPAYPTAAIPNSLFDSTYYKYSNNYATNGFYLVSNNNNSLSYDIININNITNNINNPGGLWISNQMIVPVQTQSNLGSDASNILVITGNLNTTSVTQQINGFPSNSYPPQNITSTIDLSSNTIDNYYNSGNYNQGFYLNCNINMIIRSSYFSNFNINPNLYNASLTMTQKNQPSNTLSYNFYSDNLNSDPSANQLQKGGFSINNINNNYYSSLVSGIWVLYQNPTFTITDLQLNNMGDYFYASPLVTYNITGGVNGSYSEINLTHITNITNSANPLPSTIHITNTYITPTYNIQQPSYSTSIILGISYNNIYSNIQSNSISTLNVIKDSNSYNLASSITTLNNIGTSQNSYKLGYRVWSAPSDYENTMTPSGIVPYVFINNSSTIPNNTATGTTISGNNQGYKNIPYNNIWNISNNTLANQELLIANGNFTTNHNYYMDYSQYKGGNPNNNVDYSYLSGTKFATFAWDVSASGIYNTLNFQINFNNQLYLNSQDYAFFDAACTQQLLLFYRFEYNSDVTSTSWGQNGSSYYPNTTWISINSSSSTNNSNTISVATICQYANAKNVYWYTYLPPSQIPNTNNYIFSTVLPTISLNNATLYLRIGIPDNLTNNSFNNVYAYLS